MWKRSGITNKNNEYKNVAIWKSSSLFATMFKELNESTGNNFATRDFIST